MTTSADRWRGWIPLFYAPFRHAKLKAVFSDGTMTLDRMRQLVDNTNYLVRRKVHTPDVRETHDGNLLSDRSLGWGEEFAVDADHEPPRLMGRIDPTPTGRKAVEQKELRWVSIEIKKDARLGGEDGAPRLPGPYIDHIAWLGKTPPEVKGMFDLAEARFSEHSVRMSAAVDGDEEALVIFCETGSAVLEGFEGAPPAEIDPEDEDMKPEEMQAKITALETRVTELENENKGLKKQIEDAEAASMSEFTDDCKARVEALSKAGKIGSAEAKALLEKGEKAAAEGEFARALFSEHLTTFEGRKKKVPVDGGEGGDAGAQFSDDEEEEDPAKEKTSEDSYGMSRAIFSEVSTSQAASEKFMIAVRKRMAATKETYAVARQHIIDAVRALPE